MGVAIDQARHYGSTFEVNLNGTVGFDGAIRDFLDGRALYKYINLSGGVRPGTVYQNTIFEQERCGGIFLHQFVPTLNIHTEIISRQISRNVAVLRI